MNAVDLFAVQPRISIDDYLSEEAFAAHHRALAERVAGIRTSAHALAVWPEEVATFLVLVGQGAVLDGCTTTRQALHRIVMRRLPQLLATLVRHRTARATPAVLTMLAPRAHDVYVRTFGDIARDFGLWVVAGSGLFPRAGSAPRVHNTSYMFDPAGHAVAVTRKVNLVPTQEDVLGLLPGSPDDLAVVDTPFGRVGTLICYDGFYEPHTSREPGWVRCGPLLDRLGATIVAQPSANPWAWDAPWAFNEPGETLLRSEQWFAEGFAREMRELVNVRYAVNPQLVGMVLDNVFEAPSLILGAGGRVLAQAQDAGAEDVLHLRVDDGSG